MRPAFSVAYLLCRYADTIADTHLLPAERRLYWIERFPGMIHSQNPQEAAQLAQEIFRRERKPVRRAVNQTFNPLPELV